MDIISHALWTNLIFKELPDTQRALAVTFGVLPDFFAFGLLSVKHFVKRTMHYTDPPLTEIPRPVFRFYDWSHSLVVWLGVFFLLKLFRLEYWTLVISGWGLHILFDIFTHAKDYFPTPILWPFSRFTFSGINWSNKWFMALNYCVLFFLYMVFYF